MKKLIEKQCAATPCPSIYSAQPSATLPLKGRGLGGVSGRRHSLSLRTFSSRLIGLLFAQFETHPCALHCSESAAEIIVINVAFEMSCLSSVLVAFVQVNLTIIVNS